MRRWQPSVATFGEAAASRTDEISSAPTLAAARIRDILVSGKNTRLIKKIQTKFVNIWTQSLRGFPTELTSETSLSYTFFFAFHPPILGFFFTKIRGISLWWISQDETGKCAWNLGMNSVLLLPDGVWGACVSDFPRNKFSNKHIKIQILIEEKVSILILIFVFKKKNFSSFSSIFLSGKYTAMVKIYT